MEDEAGSQNRTNTHMNNQAFEQDLSLDSTISTTRHSLKSLEQYEGVKENENEEDGNETGNEINRTVSRYSFFNDKLKQHRIKLVWKFLKIYLIISIGCLGVFSIYWGSMYQRDTRYKNLRMLVVIEDEQIGSIPPLFGNQLQQVLQTKEAKSLGQWHIFNSTTFQPLADENNNTIEQEVIRQVHHQNYWSSIYLKPNSTYNLYNSIKNGIDYNVSNSSLVSFYETGRDLVAMGQYVVPSIEGVERMWLDRNNVTQTILAMIDEIPNNSASIFTQSLQFQYYDLRPSTSPVLLAPSQIGLLYMIIVTFFQFQFFADLHGQTSKVLKKHHYLFYRIFAATLSYFVISLMFSLVTLAFQVDFTITFGKSGFLVYWMVAFLTMTAVGGMNEIMALLIIPFYPPLLGFWLIFWVIINITPTFTPIALCPDFFRYGYGLPLHNSYEISKVIFFDTYKGQFGRNIGIILAWVVLVLVLQPFVVLFFSKQMAKKAAK